MPREEAPRDPAILLDMHVAAGRILSFIEGATESSFQSDLKTQSAVLHQLLVLGEAAKRVSSAFCDAHPALPWSGMTGMRDRLIHGYDAVDLAAVWNTATEDIPKLIRLLEPLLSPRRE